MLFLDQVGNALPDAAVAHASQATPALSPVEDLWTLPEQPMQPVCQPPQTEGPMTLLTSRAHDAAGIRALAARSTALVADARASGRLDMLAHAFWLALIPGGLLFVGMQVYVYWQTGNIGLDSHAYWLAAREPDTWYTRPPAYRDAFLYSPAFGQVLQPLSVLPWP